MEDRRFLITGGAGMVGSHIADALFLQGAAEVRVLGSKDVRDPLEVTRAMEGVDVVFHQAELHTTQCSDVPRMAHEVMVDGTFNVAEAAVNAGVRKVVVASSAAVYGRARIFPTAEDHHTYGCRTLFGAAKAFNESLFRSFHEMYGLHYVALRYFDVYGPQLHMGAPGAGRLIRWMERIDAGLPPVILGDGTDIIDLVHVEDVARANLLAAAVPLTDEVFNIGSGVTTRVIDLAQALLDEMGSPLAPEFAGIPASNPVPVRQADTIRARHVLGFEASVMLESGLKSLVSWWRSQREPDGGNGMRLVAAPR